MAGPAPQPAQQPLVAPQQPVPQFAPPPGRQKGSLAPKVWGVVLLILGLMGLMMLLVNIASILGGGISASTFTVNMSPEAKAELDRVAQQIIDATKGRWTFWLHSSIEVVIAALSIVAGVFLIVKPRPVGRKLAVARALLVLLALPLYGYESFAQVEMNNTQMVSLQEIQINDMVEQQERSSPSKDPAEKERRRKEMTDAVHGMQPLMKGVGFGVVVFTALGMIAINGVLLLQMTRPAVKNYMEGLAQGGDNSIPGYDPSMGLMQGPPPGGPAQQPPANPPPQPPPQSPPV